MDKDYIIEKIKLLTVWLQALLTLSIVAVSGVVTFFISNLHDIGLTEKRIIISGFVTITIIMLLIFVIKYKINHFINLLKQ